MTHRIIGLLAAYVLMSIAQMTFSQQAKSSFTSDRHLAQGLQCSDCHGEGKKQPVRGDKCLECHQSFEEVAKRTEDMKPNPHSNHITESTDLDCTNCHKGHKQNEIYCVTCHKTMTFNRSAKKSTDAGTTKDK